MNSTTDKLTIIKIIWNSYKWFLFISIPVSIAFYIFVLLNVKNPESLTNGDAARLTGAFLKEVINAYPFAGQVAKILSKSFNFSKVTFNSVINDIIKSLVCYVLIDWVKYIFNVRKDTAYIESKAKKWFKLAVIYTSWFFLSAYISEILLNQIFQLVDNLSNKDVAFTKSIILLSIFVLSTLVFMYRTKQRLLMSFLWTLSERIVFPIITTFLLTLTSYWAFSIWSTSNTSDKWDALLFVILYIIIAAFIDFLKERVRIGIVSISKKPHSTEIII